MAFDTDVNAKSVASGQSANVVSASRSRLKGFFLVVMEMVQDL